MRDVPVLELFHLKNRLLNLPVFFDDFLTLEHVKYFNTIFVGPSEIFNQKNGTDSRELLYPRQQSIRTSTHVQPSLFARDKRQQIDLENDVNSFEH